MVNLACFSRFVIYSLYPNFGQAPRMTRLAGQVTTQVPPVIDRES